MYQYLLLVAISLFISIPRCTSVDPTPSLASDVTMTSLIDVGGVLAVNPSTTLYRVVATSSVVMASFQGCGGNLTNSTGQLTHPNYPHAMPSTVTCTWRITLDPGSRVALHFSFLTLEASNACATDSLEVWDEPSGARSLLKRYCGSLERPESLVTNGNEVEVRLQSNSTNSGRGFLITYSEFKGCNRTLTNNTGVIESPYYPDNYPFNVNCAYHIQAPAGHLVSLALEFFDLAYSSGCSEDALEVWGGVVGSSPLIGRYCGYLVGQWLQSNGNEMNIRFTSNMAETRRGFKLVYRAVQSACNSTINGSQGNLASPGGNTKCFWTIQVPPGHVISLLFDRFYLQQTEDCSRDYLVIKDGGSTVGRYCGYQKGELVYSTSESISLEYEATSGLGNVGFQIHYEAIQFECGGYLNSTRGSFQSPLFPNNYPSNVKCAWQIEQRTGYTVDLVFDKLDLEFAVNCTRDYIEVFDGVDNSIQSLGKFCRSQETGSHVITSGNVMYVEFVTNGKTRNSGFEVTYMALKTDCPRNFTNTSGVIESPNYPDFYPKSYDCQWLISYQLGYQIYVTFTYFELEYSAGCSGDYVELLDGSGVNATSRGKYCGYLVKRDPLVSTGHEMVIRFRTDGEGVNRGFVLSYAVDGTGLAPPPRAPSGSELQQTVEVTFDSLNPKQWITNRDLLFKKLVANATTLYCEANPEECGLSSAKRSRRSLGGTVFTLHQVHLVPSFPISKDLRLAVVFYVLYPSGVGLVSSWNSTAIPQNALIRAVNTSADYISSAFKSTLAYAKPYSYTAASTSSPPTTSGGPEVTTISSPALTPRESNLYLALGLSIGGAVLVLVLIIAAACYWRKRNHGKLLPTRSVTPMRRADTLEMKAKVSNTQSRRRASSLKIEDVEEECVEHI